MKERLTAVNEISKEELKQFWNIGLIFGLVSAIIYCISLYLKYNYFYTNPVAFQASSFITYFIFILQLLFCALYIRNKSVGNLGSRQIFGALFLMILMTEAAYLLFNYFYLVKINPGFTEEFRAIILNHMQELGQSSEDIAAYAEEMDTVTVEQQSFMYHFKGNIIWILIDSIIALLMSLFLKRQEI